MSRASIAPEVLASCPAASCIGRQAYVRMTCAGHPVTWTVHSSYRGAINVQTGQGLVCFVPIEAGRGPLNINIDSKALSDVGYPKPGTRLVFDDGTITFEDGQRVSLADSEVWEPTGLFRRPVFNEKLVGRNISCAREVAMLLGQMAGVGELMDVRYGAPTANLNAFSRAALPNVVSLFQAVRSGDFVGAEKATGGLVGLGPGLTPSADDMLSGIMVSLVLGSRNGVGFEGISEFTSRIAAVSRSRTSTLSREFLVQAAAGRANERLLRLVEAVYTGTTSEVRDATIDVIRIGHTSGTDMTAGVILGAGTAVTLGGWAA